MLALLAALALQPAVVGAVPTYVLTVSPAHRLVEGVAADGDNIFVSSVLDRQIIVYPRAGGAGRVIRLPDASLYPLGIAWDNQRKWLWVTGQCPKELPSVKPCGDGMLTAIDRRGKLKARLAIRGTFQPGDVFVSNGTPWVSDSRNGAVYRADANLRSLQTIFPPQQKGSAQGLLPIDEGRKFLLADYGQGVGVIDVATGKRTILLRDNGKPLRGIDGMVGVGGRIFAIYNGDAPGALIELKVVGDKLELVMIDHRGMFRDPTQLAVDGDRLLAVADAGWNDAMKPDASQRKQGATIISIPLSN